MKSRLGNGDMSRKRDLFREKHEFRNRIIFRNKFHSDTMANPFQFFTHHTISRMRHFRQSQFWSWKFQKCQIFASISLFLSQFISEKQTSELPRVTLIEEYGYCITRKYVRRWRENLLKYALIALIRWNQINDVLLDAAKSKIAMWMVESPVLDALSARSDRTTSIGERISFSWHPCSEIPEW
jgi:hypothetical protein